MALIKCPECSTEVSDRAEVCMRCGYPVRKWLQEQQREAEQAAREAEAAARREEAERRRAEREAARVIPMQEQPVPKLKLILVIVFGCLWILPQIIIRIIYFDPEPLSTAIYILRYFIVNFLIHAGVFLAVVRKKIPAIIVSAGYIILMPLIMIITTSPHYSYDWISFIPGFLMAGLTIVYAALGVKVRNSVIFFIISAVLFIAEISYELIKYPYVLQLVSMLLYVVILCFFTVGFSPDKWWPKRKAKIPPPPVEQAAE